MRAIDLPYLNAGTEGGKRGKPFPTLAAAKAWRHDALVALRKGTLPPAPAKTLRQAADEFVRGAATGAVLNRSGDPYKPSTLRGYAEALELRVLPELGPTRLADLRLTDMQRLVDNLVAQGLNAAAVRNTAVPVRAICRRALSLGELSINPCTGLTLPAVRGRRERIATPTEARALLAALPAAERAVWTTAFYAGLRRGELQALEWPDVDLQRGVIRVHRSWDPVAGPSQPKSRAGSRIVPIPSALRQHLVARRLGSPDADGLVFGRTPTRPFEPTTLRRRSRRAWAGVALEPDAFIARGSVSEAHQRTPGLRETPPSEPACEGHPKLYPTQSERRGGIGTHRG